MFGQVTWGFWSLGQAVKSLGRDRVWVPFAAYAGLQLALLAALTNFYVWPLSAVLVPLLRSGLGEATLHYPFHFLALPAAWTRIGVAVDLLLGGCVMGWTYMLLMRSGGAKGDRARAVIGRWWAFALARIPFAAALVVLLIWIPDRVVGGETGLGGNALRLFRVGIVAAAVGLEGLYILIPFFLLRDSLLKSLKDGLGFVLRYPLAVYLIVAVPTLLHVPLLWLLGRSQVLIYRMAPETVGWLLALNLALAGVTSYVAVVGAGRFHETVRSRVE